MGGTNASYFILQQLPILEPGYSADVVAYDWIADRVLKLTYTAWDLEPFGRELGYSGPPFRWDADRRFLLRCELDAAFFHLYGLEHDDIGYVMDTFPIIRDRDVKAHGEYRTKRVILEIYDELARASESGEPYETRLDPPPADPRVAPTLSRQACCLARSIVTEATQARASDRFIGAFNAIDRLLRHRFKVDRAKPFYAAVEIAASTDRSVGHTSLI